MTTATNRLASASAAFLIVVTLWATTISEPAMAASTIIVPAIA